MSYAAALLSPVGMQVGLSHAKLTTSLPLAFNVIVSNVGNTVQARHPVPIPTHGVASTVTMMSYADTVTFGFVGDRDVLPHLQCELGDR